MWMGRIVSPPLFLLHTETQKPSLQSALAVRHVGQRLRGWCCGGTVVRLGLVGTCLLEFAARTTTGAGAGGLPEKWTGEKEWREEPEEVEEAAVLAGLPTLILLLLLLPEEEEAVLVSRLLPLPSSSALLAGSSEDLQ